MRGWCCQCWQWWLAFTCKFCMTALDANVAMAVQAGPQVSARAGPVDEASQRGAPAVVRSDEREGVSRVLRDMVAEMIPRGKKEGFEPPPLLRRLRLQLQHNGPKLKAAAMQSYRDCKDWVVAGGTFRILLALAVLGVAGSAAAGVLLFGAIAAVATVNAMLVATVLCLAAACSFLAMFLAALSAVYVSVLVVSATVIGVITLIAVSSAIGVSLLVGGLYVAYRAGSVALQVITFPIVLQLIPYPTADSKKKGTA